MPNTEYLRHSKFIEGVVAITDTAPVNPEIGRLWLDTSPGASVDATLAIVTITGNTTLDATNTVVLCDAASAAFTVTLPAAEDSLGRRYYIKKIDATANAVTIDGNGSETTDDDLTQVLRDQYADLEIVSDSTGWWIL